MKIAKWGNSLAVRIPKDVAEALGLVEGDDIALHKLEDRHFAVDKLSRTEAALQTLRRLRRPLPADYRFDRDEANAR